MKKVLKNNVDEIMWRRKVSVTELAERTGISQPRISAIKNNPYINLTSDTIVKLCDGLNLGLCEFAELAEVEDDQAEKIEEASLVAVELAY